jgi:hypothetical protein
MREDRMAASTLRPRASANDNVLEAARPLTRSDVEVIIDEHGAAIGLAVDQIAASGNGTISAFQIIHSVLLRMPELQRTIVWYGSDLKRPVVDVLKEGANLLAACAEVLSITRAEYDDSIVRFVLLLLREHSTYLNREGAF